MSDYISRADAIEAIRTTKIVFDSPIDGFVKHDITDLVATVLTEAFEALPSADAAHGKWQRFNDEYGTYWTGCSNCKGDIPKDKYGVDIYTDFCPNCGARMKGGEDE